MMERFTKRVVWHGVLGLMLVGSHASARDQGANADSKTLRALMAENPGLNLANDQDRDFVVKKMQERADERRAAVVAKAKQKKYPLRVKDSSGLRELVDFDGERPVYYMTRNVNAAKSLNTQLLQAAPYGASGLGLQGDGATIGVWDGGPALFTHQEFKDASGLSRVILGDRPSWTSDEHATHVGGTLIASGVVPSAKGMAPKAKLLSYDWFSDIAEMTANGAATGIAPSRIHLSNHSYGEGMGWHPMGVWTWFGTIEDASKADAGFGRYSAKAAELDALANASPYYTVFRAVGNDDADTPPVGAQIRMSPAEGSPVELYNPAIHPPGDSNYMGGFGTMGYDDCAKNIISVGSVDDPIGTDGKRNPNLAVHTFFSSKGPTDDGRIKPDICANGWRVYSSVNQNDTAYASFSGTSMASPNLCGSAALLVQHHQNLFGGEAMRNHTLKCLLLHTADDLGNKGPDYTFGWGLANVKAAADLLSDHKANPSLARLTVDTLSTSKQSVTIPLIWDGISPIKATLSWTDPAAAVVTQHDSRVPQLVNDLDVKILAPNGSPYLPWVMPFVDDWSVPALSMPAVTGRNKTDNTEQVCIDQPYLPGIYQVVVTYTGTLKNDSQMFTLCTSGGALVQPPAPPPFTVTNWSVPFGYSGQKTSLLVSGSGLRADTRAILRRSGSNDVALANAGASGADWKFDLDLTGATSGDWDLVFINPYNDTITKASAYTVLTETWRETFEMTGLPGWSSTALYGYSAWTRSEGWSSDGIGCYEITHNPAKNTTQTVSPAVNVPSGATRLIVSWQNSTSLRTDGSAGLRVEWSADNGASWNDIDAAGSQLTVSGVGYNGTLGSGTTGSGLKAMIGSRVGETALCFPSSMAAQFAGKSMRFRWTLYSASTTGNTIARFDALRVNSDASVTLPSVTVASVMPPRVVLNREATLHVRGTNFAEGVKVYLRRTGSGFSYVNAIRVMRLNSGELSVDVPGISDSNARNLIVVNPDGETGMLTDGVSAVADSGIGIGIQTVTPAYGNRGSTMSCLIQGQGFSTGMEVRLTNESAPEIVASGINLLSPTLLEATFDLGAATVGDWSVEAKSATGVAVKCEGVFSVLAESATLPPALVSVTPGYSRTGTPVRLSLKGFYFKPGSSVKLVQTGLNDIVGTSLTLTGSNQIDATFEMRSNSASVRNVVLTGPDGSTSTLVGGFLVNPAPVVSSCSPNSCYLGQSAQVTIKGNYFMPNASARLRGATANVDVTGLTVVDANTITGTVAIPTSILIGQYAVEVTNPDSQMGQTNGLFTVKSATAVEITSASPMRFPAGKTSVVSVTGANFKAGCTAKLTRSSTTYTSSLVTAVSANLLECTFALSSGAWVGGPYTLTVTTADNKSTTYPNFYIDAAEPTITQVTANSAASGTVPRIAVYGANVGTVTGIVFRKAGCADIVPGPLNIVTSSGYISFDLNLAGAEAGMWDVVVTNQTGYVVTAARAFTVTPVSGQPVLTSVSPNAGAQGSMVNLALSGTGFTSGSSVKLKRTGVSDVTCGTPVVTGTTAMTCQANLSGAGPGLWDVVVTSSGGLTSTLAGAFTVNAGAGSTFATWQSGKFTAAEIAAGSGNPTGDFDHDGLSNLMEYAIDSDPKSRTVLGAMKMDSTGIWFEITRPQGGRSDLIYSAESSSDMITWNTAVLDVYQSGTTEKMRVRDPLTSGDPSKRFIRLKVATK